MLLDPKQADDTSLKLPSYNSPQVQSPVSLKYGGQYNKAGESSMVHMMHHQFNPPHQLVCDFFLSSFPFVLDSNL